MPKERASEEEPMMQSILADRCQFKAHGETKEPPVYDLVIAKGGLKVKEATPNEGSMEDMGIGGRMIVRAMPVDTIVYALSGEVGRKIVDRTGPHSFPRHQFRRRPCVRKRTRLDDRGHAP
jgi:uncharacterized protein (TIGR03435 family)